MVKKIAFSNQKGGVGKTTTCVNIAAYLAENGKKVLVIDLDSQANASSSLGIFDKKAHNSTYDVLLGDKSVSDCARDTEINGLKLIPANSDLAGADIELASVKGRERVLANKLLAVEDDFDYILIDCAPSLGLVIVNALTAADGIVVPIVCEYLALEGLAQLLETIRLVRESLNKSLEIEGLVFTMYDSHTNLSRQVVEDVKENLDLYIFKQLIPRNVRLAEAPSFGEPVDIFDMKSSGAKAYKKLANELVKKNEKKDKE